MLRISATAFFVACLFFSSPVRAADDAVVGTIVEVEGTAQVIPASGAQGAPAVAETTTVHMGDTVVTGAQSRAFVLFIDNTQLTLSENARVTIDDYVFNPDNDRENKAAYSVTGGAFQYISGLIGHKEDPDVHIDTPVGSIGIRGTNFWGGTFDGKYNVAVIDGKVALKTDAGEELVQKGEGTSVADRRHRPLRAARLDSARFGRMAATVKLQRRDIVNQRIHEMQSRNWVLQRNYKNYMQANRRDGRWLNRPEPGKQKELRNERREELQERRQERLQKQGLMQPEGGQGLQPGLLQQRRAQMIQQGGLSRPALRQPDAAQGQDDEAQSRALRRRERLQRRLGGDDGQ